MWKRTAVFCLVMMPGALRAQGPEAQEAAPEGRSDITVLQTTTRRVSVDVVVTDANGKPVTGFSRGDFSVFEDGVLQPVRSFDPHTPSTEAPYVAPEIPKLPPNTFLNLATAPETGTPTILLYDVLNTPVESQGYAHEEMIRFIKQRKPGTQIAVFVLSDKLHLLQGFTDDSALLTRSLDRNRGSVGQSTELSTAGGTATSSDSLAPATLPDANPREYQQADVTHTLSEMGNFEALEQTAMLDQRIEITLDGLTEVGRFLAGLPGRKNLIWLSASFPAGVLPNANTVVTTLAQDQSTRNYGDQIKEATDLLNLSHVAVYPVDVRGVVVPGTYAASSSTQYGPGTTGSGKAVSAFVQQQASEHGTMDSIAESTGGHAYYSTNDLKYAIDRAIADGSTYYAMTYSPTNVKLDGKLRKIKVSLNKPGYRLSYRTSYYADDLQRAAQAAADAPQSPLSASLERGAPEAHELFVEARLQAIGKPEPATPKQLEMLAAYEAMTSRKKRKKSSPAAPESELMQRYLITYGLVPRQLTLVTEPNGAHKAELEMGVLSYDHDGRKLNGIDSQMEDNIPAARYAKLSEEGYHLFQTVILPVTAASVRLAIRDKGANRIGSIEVPLPLTAP